MDYAEARAWLDSLGEFHMEFGLDRLRAVLGALGNPERGAPAIHVAGTNGKGMTCAFASSILRHAGKRVGLYTSPHLSRPNERISIDGRPIDDAGFAAALTTTREGIDRAKAPLTYFETMTVAAFVAFRHAGVDVRVLEVGLGGRLDATNVVDPAVTVITSISLDHTSVLGTTIEAIAEEKAGILKPGVPMVVAAQHPVADEVIRRRAEAVGAPRHWLAEGEAQLGAMVRDLNTVVQRLSSPIGETSLGGGGRDVVRERAATAAVMAILSAEVLGPSPEATQMLIAALPAALKAVEWPGRLEDLLGPDGVPLLLDGGHNPGAAKQLATLEPFGRGASPRVLLFAAMMDKDRRGILRELVATKPTHTICTSVHTARSATARTVSEDARAVLGDQVLVEAVDDHAVAFRRALEIAGRDGRVLITGSLYLVGRVREIITGGPPTSIG